VTKAPPRTVKERAADAILAFALAHPDLARRLYRVREWLRSG